MFLLVDATSLTGDPELSYLLSFAGVEGLTVERHVTLVERPNRTSYAALGQARSRHVLVAPLEQFKRFAAKISARPGCPFPADVVERAMAFSHLAGQLHADAVVSPARTAFGPSDRGLLRCRRIVTVAEALAMIGAHVRQRDDVPLGGRPLHVQRRTEVYPLTANVILPSGQEWWSACVQSAQASQTDQVALGQAVFTRLGQALRGRDGVHEALRLGRGREGILDALHHLDGVLTHSVGSLDALASAAHGIFGMTSAAEPAWQRRWRKELAKTVPTVAGVVAPDTRLGVALRILTVARNSIHGSAFDEYLDVGAHGAEHRAMMPRELGDELCQAGESFAPLSQHGLFLDGPGVPFLNVGLFAERLLVWTLEIVDALQRAMLASGHMTVGDRLTLSRPEEAQRQYCRALARVGAYPCDTDTGGLPAASSLYGRIMGIIHQHRSSPKK